MYIFVPVTLPQMKRCCPDPSTSGRNEAMLSVVVSID